MISTSQPMRLWPQNCWNSKMCYSPSAVLWIPILKYRETKWIDSTLTISQASPQAIFVARSPVRDHFDITISTPSLESRLTKVHSRSLTSWLKSSASAFYTLYFVHFVQCMYLLIVGLKVCIIYNCWDLPCRKIWRTVLQECKIISRVSPSVVWKIIGI